MEDEEYSVTVTDLINKMNLINHTPDIDTDKILIKGSSAEIAYLGSCVRAITDIDIAITTILEDRLI